MARIISKSPFGTPILTPTVCEQVEHQIGTCDSFMASYTGITINCQLWNSHADFRKITSPTKQKRVLPIDYTNVNTVKPLT